MSYTLFIMADEKRSKRIGAPERRAFVIRKRAKPEPEVTPAIARPLSISNASVIEGKDYSKLSVDQRKLAAKNKFHFYQRSREQIVQFSRICRGY